ncbi:DUF6612 family protein [Chloroflexota bacterium]
MKRIAIIGIILLTLVAGFVIGCTEKDLSQKELNQVVSSVLSKNSEVNTCRFQMNLLETVTISKDESEAAKPGGESDPNTVTVNISGSGTGAMDKAAQAMQIALNMTTETPGEGKQDVSMESYLVSGAMYTKVTVPQKGEQWIKMSMPEGIWESQNRLNQQAELLAMAEEVKYLGIEDVGGIQCYVVAITPSAKSINELVSQVAMPAMGGIDPSKINLANMIKEMSIKQWVARDSYLFMKTSQHMTMELNAEDLGIPKDEFAMMAADISVEMTFSDYNQPVSIELPQAALEAVELKQK